MKYSAATVIFALSFVCACDPQETIQPQSEKGSSQVAITTSAVKADAGATPAAATTPSGAAPAAALGVTRHLPGTVITTATGKYAYLVRSNGTVSPFASASLATASGYAASMIITVSVDELYCYGRGDQITAALPPPPSGMLADGTIVKESGKSTIYIVSDGVAWSTINETTFKAAGYNYETLVTLSAGTLASKVDAVGNCGEGIACLDSNYLYSCAQDDPIVTVTPITTPVITVTPTVTATTVATAPVTTTMTSTPVVIVTPTVSATSITTSTPIATATATTITVIEPTPTVVTTTVATATPTATATATATATVTTPTVTVTPTVTATVTATSVATSTVTSTSPPTTVDLTWVYAASGTKLCLNADYFAGGDKAVLLIWSGPGADAASGPVAMQSGDRFCWDFMNRQKGLYTFWADEPEASCGADICPRDTIPGNGAQYMTAPKATAEARKWLHCETTGCDGMAYWDGTALSPMGD